MDLESLLSGIKDLINSNGEYMKIKKYIKALWKYITNPRYRFLINAGLGKYNKMPDEEYLKKMYYATMGKQLNLDNPQTFNEKLQWLKLHNRKDIYTVMVDKYLVRDYIKEKLGEEYLIPLLGVYDKPEDIDFDKLPNQFVLKCNHNSGLGMYICKDKSKLTKRDFKKIRKELSKGLKEDYYLYAREWPYKNVPRKIVAEEFLEENERNGADSLIDYKWFCFNGEPKIMYIGNDASQHPTCDWFDMKFNFLNIRDKDPNSETLPKKPLFFNEMKSFAKKLSEGTKFLRVDFYIVNGHLYVGELTFFHCAGFVSFHPEEMDKKLGNLIILKS